MSVYFFACACMVGWLYVGGSGVLPDMRSQSRVDTFFGDIERAGL